MNHLQGIPESMLIPLAARASETNHAQPIIKDKVSKEIFDSLDYPFDNLMKSSTTQLGISIRTFILDNFVKNFVTYSKKPFIINIGCGLDTRLKRLNLDTLPWIDIDVPEAITIRSQFFRETAYNKMFPKSMLDYNWIDMVKKHKYFNKECDILIIFEGVLMYFDEETISQLLEKIHLAFDNHNLFFAIEFCSKTIANNTKHHQSVSKLTSKPYFKYGYNKLIELDTIKPKNIHVAKEMNYFDYFHKRWGFFGLCRFIPFFKRRLNNKIVIMTNLSNDLFKAHFKT